MVPVRNLGGGNGKSGRSQIGIINAANEITTDNIVGVADHARSCRALGRILCRIHQFAGSPRVDPYAGALYRAGRISLADI